MIRQGTLILAVLLTTHAVAQAHELRPGYLELSENGTESYDVLWKVPALGEMRLALYPRFPETCRPKFDPIRFQTADAYMERATISCPGGLGGRRITIDGLTATLTDVLVRFSRTDGSVQILRVQPSAPYFEVRAAQSRLEASTAYMKLGIEHILLGIDHLLFVLGLLLIVKDRWMLLKTVTSFTVAHSITLIIATLGYAHAPVPPLNAAIALSILFLGPEIVRSWRGESSLTIRRPWVVAFAFGLLHGFGFAGGLTTLGLPQAEIPPALLLFNLGVEAGQILFVLLIVLLERSFQQLEIRWSRWAETLPGYVVGSLGAFWTIQRVAIMLGVVR